MAKVFLNQLKAISRGQRNAHRVEGILLAVVEEMHFALRNRCRCIVLVGQNNAGRADAAHRQPVRQNSRADRAASIIRSASKHLRCSY